MSFKILFLVLFSFSVMAAEREITSDQLNQFLNTIPEMRGNAGQLIRNAEVIFSKGVALPRNWEEQLKPYNKPDETSKYRYVLYESQGCGGSFGIILKIDPRSHTVESPKIWGKTYSGRCSSK